MPDNIFYNKKTINSSTDINYILRNSSIFKRAQAIWSEGNQVFEKLSLKWRNYFIRTIMTCLMLTLFCCIIYLGPYALVVLVTFIQFMCFKEIMNIGYRYCEIENFPFNRQLSWYFWIVANYYLFGKYLKDSRWFSEEIFIQSLLRYHGFISYCLYITGFVGFVLSLLYSRSRHKYNLFVWTHVTLLFVATSSHLIIRSIFFGLLWFLVPMSAVIFNDITAYLFGFFIGKTPLIEVSPRKTWEGFIGGAISCVIFSILFTLLLIQFDYFKCPFVYNDFNDQLMLTCNQDYLYRPIKYQIPTFLAYLSPITHLLWYPVLKHTIVIGLFSALIAPFGGFFASGFKRTFNIKDFSSLIPGHGGITDRFDCSMLMCIFVFVYHQAFVEASSMTALLGQVHSMTRNDQLQLYQRLNYELFKRDLF